MAEIKVTYARLKETADVIAASKSEYMGIMSEIKSIMETLRGKWESEAAERFREQFLKLDVNFEKYAEQLNEYCQYLNITAEEYATVDNKVADDVAVLDNSSLLA